MRILGLPEQFDLTMKCMIQNATQPLPSPNAVDMYLKPKFPFNLSLALLIEKYMCRIHKSLEELTGKNSTFILRQGKWERNPSFCAISKQVLKRSSDLIFRITGSTNSNWAF